jgi:hypothetical protein
MRVVDINCSGGITRAVTIDRHTDRETNKACVRFLRSTKTPALSSSPGAPKPLSGDFCSRIKASARLESTPLSYSRCLPSQVPVLSLQYLVRPLLLTPDHRISANTVNPDGHTLTTHPPPTLQSTYTCSEACLVVFLRRAKHPIYPSLPLPPPSSSPRRTHALQIASLASPDHSTVANPSPTASRGLRTVRSPQPLVSCCTFASLEMASKVCMLRRPPPVDANGSAPCATVQHWRPTTQDLC